MAPGPEGVLIACEDPAVLKEFEQLLASLAGSSLSGGPELTIFYLKYAKATAVAETLERILGGTMSASRSSFGGDSGGGFSGRGANTAPGETGAGFLGALLGMRDSSSTTTPAKTFKITPELRLNALIVQASPAEVAAIQQLLTVLDQKEGPEEVEVVPKVRIISVKNVQAEEIANIIRQVYQDRMAAGAGLAGLPPGAQNFLPMLGGGLPGFGAFGGGLPGGGDGGEGRNGGGRAGAREDTQRMTVGVDQRTNSIILSAPEPLFSQVQQLIAQLDDAALAESDQTMRVVTLQKASPSVVQQALAAIVGDGVQFGRMGMGPAGSSMAISSRRFGQQIGNQGYRGSRPGVAFPGGSYQAGGAYQGGSYQPGVSYVPNNGFSSTGGYQPGGYMPSSGYQSGGYQPSGYMPSSGYLPGGYLPGGYTPGGGYPAGGGYQPGGVPYYGVPGRTGSMVPGVQPGYQPPMATPMPAPFPEGVPFP